MSSDRPFANTLVPYMYRDAHNYKAHAEVVFDGTITDEERTALEAGLQDGEYFVPGSVDLADARDVDSRWTGVWDDEIDHNLNEIHMDEIEVCDRAPTDERTISEFVAALVALNDPDGEL